MDRSDERYEHWIHQLVAKSLKLTLYPTSRRDMEPHENRLPTKTSPRTPRQRSRRQRHSPHRKTQLPPLRHGHPPRRRRRCKRRNTAPSPQRLNQQNSRPPPQPIPPRRNGIPLHAHNRHGLRRLRSQRS